jgi:hypothetical protein
MEALDKQCTESTSSLDTDGLLGDYTFWAQQRDSMIFPRNICVFTSSDVHPFLHDFFI